MVKTGAISFAAMTVCTLMVFVGLESGNKTDTIINIALASLNGGMALHNFATYIRGEN